MKKKGGLITLVIIDSCEGLAVYGQRRIRGNSQIGSWLAEPDLNFGNEN